VYLSENSRFAKHNLCAGPIHTSPIEHRLWEQICASLSDTPRAHVDVPAGEAFDRLRSITTRFGLVATRQLPWGRYIIDIAILVKMDSEFLYVAIECDGHEFHERTKEQAARDKSRDRALAADGVIVLRFTGSEIWHNTWECSEEVFLVLGNKLERHLMKTGGLS